MLSLSRLFALFLAFFLLSGCADPITGFSEQTHAQECVLERFKVSINSPHLRLPVEVQGKQYCFALDTGATISVYDMILRTFLGDPLGSAVIHTSQGELNVISYSSPISKLGHLDLPAMSPVICMDLEKMRDLGSEQIYGLLGMDFLGDHVFRINLDRGEVTFLRSIGSDPGVRIPITFQNHVPQVKVSIAGLCGDEIFQVDTGFGGMTSGGLREEVFDILAKRGILSPIGNSTYVTLSGSGASQEGLIEVIHLGNFTQKKLLFQRTKSSFLSLNYLSHYVVTFDFPNGAMYLKKGRQFDRLDDWGRIGGRGKEKGDSVNLDRQ